MPIRPRAIVGPTRVLRVVNTCSELSLSWRSLQMKETSIVIHWGRQLFIAVIKIKQRLPLRIKINAAFERQRLGSDDGKRRIINIVVGEGELAPGAGLVDCYLLRRHH